MLIRNSLSERGRSGFPLFGKEGPGEISAVTHGFSIYKKIPLNPPLPKGGNFSGEGERDSDNRRDSVD
jgi:hypothetical protein